MPTASDTRLLPVAAQTLWQLVCDPHHLPRWWPRVERVEGVGGAAFTEVLRSERGRLVRADFEIVERDDVGMRLVWTQQVAGTPFARVLAASETELRLTPTGELGAGLAAVATGPTADAGATGTTAGAAVAGTTAGAGSAGDAIDPAATATEVTITLSQTLHGWLARSSARPPGALPLLDGLFARLGGPMVRKAAARTVKEALDGLERIAV